MSLFSWGQEFLGLWLTKTFQQSLIQTLLLTFASLCFPFLSIYEDPREQGLNSPQCLAWLQSLACFQETAEPFGSQISFSALEVA